MDKVEAFKNELRNYNFYKHQQQMLLIDIDTIEYEMTNVKGLRYDIEHTGGSYNESEAFERYDKLSKELEELEKELDRVTKQIEHIYNVLSKLSEDVRKYCINIYVKKQTYNKMAIENYNSPSAIYKQVYKELNKIL